jgi:hypothetical protein
MSPKTGATVEMMESMRSKGLGADKDVPAALRRE